jgi:ABC-2 type transport system permease protein
MNKIFLITKREYLSRVKKKSFIVMTILSPLLIILFYGLIFFFSFNKDLTEDKKNITVCDESGLFTNKLKDSKTIVFNYNGSIKGNEENYLKQGDDYGILIIPQSSGDSLGKVTFISKEQPSLSTQSYMEDQIENVLKNIKLGKFGIEKELLDKVNETSVSINTVKLTDEGLEKGNTGVTTAIGYFSAFLIYLFIFLYGVQVMRGVIEEKTNRIVEVIISSVKPFQLMMGKIIGIALVGLTQFILWALLVIVLSPMVSKLILSFMDLPPDAIQSMSAATQQGAAQVKQNGVLNFLSDLSQYNFTLIIGMFIFYFVSGYLFYGALFAAVGSAVDSETDTQQFMLPITIPLVFSLVVAQSVVTSSPNGNISFWLSMIPLTSPIVMMVRLPFGVPAWQLGLSMLCMIAGFVTVVWIAGRIYRIGILMYGKKPSYKDLIKWIGIKQ